MIIIITLITIMITIIITIERYSLGDLVFVLICESKCKCLVSKL